MSQGQGDQPLALTHCGAEGTRTPDPLHAMQVRYQLRHSPELSKTPGGNLQREITPSRYFGHNFQRARAE